MGRNDFKFNELNKEERQIVEEYISKLFQIGICYLTKKESEI